MRRIQPWDAASSYGLVPYREYGLRTSTVLVPVLKTLLAAAQPSASWERHDGGRRALPYGLLDGTLRPEFVALGAPKSVVQERGER